MHIIYNFNWIIELFWYCNIAAIILALGILFNKKELIGAVLITAVPAQFLWILDFILNLFGYGFGRTQWLFTSGLFIFTVSVILHASLIPISFFGVYKTGFSKKSLLYGFIIFILLMFPLTYIFTPATENINCISYPCDLNIEKDSIKILSNSDYMTLNYLIKVMLFWSFILIISYFIHLSMFKKFSIKVN